MRFLCCYFIYFSTSKSLSDGVSHLMPGLELVHIEQIERKILFNKKLISLLPAVGLEPGAAARQAPVLSIAPRRMPIQGDCKGRLHEFEIQTELNFAKLSGFSLTAECLVAMG